MAQTLQNDNIAVTVDNPGENYQESRFDWTGKIVEVRYKSHTLTTNERFNDPDIKTKGRGLYNEFGIDQPIGYHECIPNQYFHKIGVGKLLKTDNAYDFFKSYPIIPAHFETHPKNNQLSITCYGEKLNGYAYTLKKYFLLQDDGLTIGYELHNTGEKNIETNEYTHNFLATDHYPMGPDYQLQFEFDILADQLTETVNPDHALVIQNNKIFFQSSPSQQFFLSNLCHGKKTRAKWTLINTKAKTGICEEGDFDVNKINVWGWKHVISPELFFNIFVQPGESLKWHRKYTFFEL